jgi:hypothetical protein
MNISRWLSVCLLLLVGSLAMAKDENLNKGAESPSGKKATSGQAPTPNKDISAPSADLAPKDNRQPNSVDSDKQSRQSPETKSYTGLIVSMTLTVLLAIIGLGLLVRKWTVIPTLDVHHVHTGTGSSVDPKAVATEVVRGMAASPVLSKIATISNLERQLTSLQTSVNSMQQTLPQAAGKAAADEVSKSQVGDMKSKLAQLQAELDAANSKASLDRQSLDTANAEVIDADRAKRQAMSDLSSATAALQGSQAREAQLRQDIEDKTCELQLALDEVRSAQMLCQQAKGELQRTWEVGVPAGISDPELIAQMKALHRESIKGNSSSMVAWATLSSFAAADADPASNEFLLQVVRRLSLVLVSHWKTQESISQKDRHAKLSQWAKCLTAHAQGKFSLIVPPIGAPVNKTTMATADNATTVQEVLCWQVRNSAGSTFSLAEIA